jgi:hypothetical protein
MRLGRRSRWGTVNMLLGLGLFGVVIMALAGLISRNRVRNWIRKFTNRNVDKGCDDLAVAFLLIGTPIAIVTMVTGYVNHRATQNKLSETQSQLEKSEAFIDPLRTEREAVEKFKKTEPITTANLSVNAKKKFIVNIKPTTRVPIVYQIWLLNKDGTIVNQRRSRIVSRIDHDGKHPYLRETDVELRELKEGYIELHLSYQSIYAGAFNNPKNLEGKIVHKYKISDGTLMALEE